MPGGRPTDYDSAYCERLVEHMAEGASATSFAAEIGVCRATLNVWAEKHPEFLEALSRGKAKCASWWEKVGRNSAQDGKGNATMIVFGLRNMAQEDWQDVQKRELSGPGGKAIEHNVKTARDLSDDDLAAIAGRK